MKSSLHKTSRARIRTAAVAVVAACSMLLPAGMAAAAETPGISVKQGAGYTATKISHPNAGLGEVDGMVNVDGNGQSTDDLTQGTADRGQNYAWSSVGYGDWMYVGTSYSTMGTTLKYMAVNMKVNYDSMKKALNAAFNGQLFLDNGENRSLLLKINTKTGEVKIVVPPVTSGYTVNGYRAAVEFHDKLYFSVAATGRPYLLEVDPNNLDENGVDATRIVYTPEGLTAVGKKKGYSSAIRALAVVNDQLIAGMIDDNGALLVASSDPSKGQDSFAPIASQTNGLYDYPACSVRDNVFGGCMWDMVGFNGKLYVTIVTGRSNTRQSFALVRGEQDQDTRKWTFTPLVGDTAKDGAKYEWGFGAERSGAANLVVYDNHLYIGGYNDPMNALQKVMEMDFSDLSKDLDNPVNLWRMDANENFEMLSGESGNKYFGDPKGTIDGKTMLAGLGSSDEQSRYLNQYVWRMQSYDGKLYVGTFDISDLAYPATQFANGDILHRTPEEWKTQIKYIKEFLDSLKAVQNDQQDSDDAGIAVQSNDPDVRKVEESGKTDAVINDLESMEKTLTQLGGDLESKQTDTNMDGVAVQSADAYTFADRQQFLKALQQLLDLYNKVKPYLPDSITSKLDKWLNQDTVEKYAAFVNVLSHLHYSNKTNRGFDLVTTADGLNFQTITRNGFGDNNNHGLRVFAVTNTGLNVGTANPFQGAQIWKLDDGKGDVVNAELTNGDAYVYDKYDAKAKSQNQQGLNVGVKFNGNTVEDVQYDYESLQAGKDYTVNKDGSGITLSSEFLNGKKTGSTGSVIVFFNRGARARFTVQIKDSTPAEPVEPSPAKPAKPTASDAKKDVSKSGATANTGSAVLGVAVAVSVMALAAGAVLVLKRRA